MDLLNILTTKIQHYSQLTLMASTNNGSVKSFNNENSVLFTAYIYIVKL